MTEPSTPSPQEPTAPMLDVHPPHEPIHGWRDFLLHILTITIGLLIALALEGLVERIHHRHLLNEARAQINEEITHNRQILAEDRHFLELGMQQTRANMDLLDSRATEGKGRLHLGWQWEGLDSAAWQTARDTGALALMPYPEVQRFAGVYLQQELLNSQINGYIQANTRVTTPLLRTNKLMEGATAEVAALSLAQRDEIAQNSAAVLTQLSLMMDLARSLDHEYAGVVH